MSNPNEVLERIRLNKETGKLWKYPGGIHPAENKKQSNQKAIRQVGDEVLKGQALTKGENYRQLPVHAPTSGKVVAIEPHASSHPSGLPEMTVIIETDGKDQWVERQPIEDFLHFTTDKR